jgi:hypothetical protein
MNTEEDHDRAAERIAPGAADFEISVFSLPSVADCRSLDLIGVHRRSSAVPYGL